MKIITRLILFTFLSSVTSGCMNSYERSVVGNYKVYEAKFRTPRSAINLSLVLRRNKSFSLQGDKIDMKGSWEAGDDGDRTWLNLKTKEEEIQCRILGQDGEIISMNNSFYLIDEYLSELSFKRQD